MQNNSKIALDVVVLSNTLNDSIYKMNQQCFNSLFNSEKNLDITIILVESNKNASYKYDSNRIKVIVPNSNFGFNKFINIGLSYCKSDFIAICNNDLIFKKKWFSEIYNVSVCQPDILSFSPIDKSYSMMRRLARKYKHYHVGWNIRKEIAGWCIVIKKDLLNRLNPFDERFDFYFSDNDYGFTLKQNEIKHALVMNSKVKHLEEAVSKNVRRKDDTGFFKFVDRDTSSYPAYLNKEKYSWILDDDKTFENFLTFYDKWGNPDFLAKVSVLIIMETDNIKETIDSIFTQTWTNIEIIILYVGDVEEDYKVAKAYEAKAVKVYRKRTNSRNIYLEIFEKSNGDFIQIINSGDRLSEDKIEESVLALQKYCDLDLVCSANAVLDENIQPLYRSSKKMKKHVSSMYLFFAIFIKNYPTSLSSFILSRNLMKKVCERIKLDSSFVFISELMRSTRTIYFEKEGQVFYHQRNLLNITNNKIKKKFELIFSFFLDENILK